MAVQTGPKNPVFLGLWPPSWSSYDICPRKQEIGGAQDLSINVIGLFSLVEVMVYFLTGIIPVEFTMN